MPSAFRERRARAQDNAWAPSNQSRSARPASYNEVNEPSHVVAGSDQSVISPVASRRKGADGIDLARYLVGQGSISDRILTSLFHRGKATRSHTDTLLRDEYRSIANN